MAKKQTFGDKTSKDSTASKTMIKLIKSTVSKETNGVRFSESIVGVPSSESVESYIKKIISN
mgnify:CR=1 FL=1|tara:strand:- start:288 stop:473 length:186 start_codon:yes stop_codon:yes gene_type:complete